MALNVLRAAGKLLDYLFVMSYDAGDKRSPPGAPTGYDAKARAAGGQQPATWLAMRWMQRKHVPSNTMLWYCHACLAMNCIG